MDIVCNNYRLWLGVMVRLGLGRGVPTDMGHSADGADMAEEVFICTYPT